MTLKGGTRDRRNISRPIDTAGGHEYMTQLSPLRLEMVNVFISFVCASVARLTSLTRALVVHSSSSICVCRKGRYGRVIFQSATFSLSYYSGFLNNEETGYDASFSIFRGKNAPFKVRNTEICR